MNEVYTIYWTYVARNDLTEIIEYLARDSSSIAIKILEKIENHVNELTKLPKRGRVIPELQRNNIVKYRELIISPWRIFYSIEAVNIYIHAVVDGRRNVEDFLLKRQLR